MHAALKILSAKLREKHLFVKKKLFGGVAAFVTEAVAWRYSFFNKAAGPRGILWSLKL